MRGRAWVVACVLVCASGCASAQDEVIAASRAIHGEIGMLRLIASIDQRGVPPAPTLRVSVRDMRDELDTSRSDVTALEDAAVRDRLLSIVDRTAAVAVGLEQQISDHDRAGLADTDAKLVALQGELDRAAPR